MTIDEAIEKHEKLKINAESTNDKRGAFYSAEEHKQLVEWLEELKNIRKWKSDVMDAFCRYDCNSVEEAIHNGYIKGIQECLGILYFYADRWDGIYQAIYELEEKWKELEDKNTYE